MSPIKLAVVTRGQYRLPSNFQEVAGLLVYLGPRQQTIVLVPGGNCSVVDGVLHVPAIKDGTLSLGDIWMYAFSPPLPAIQGDESTQESELSHPNAPTRPARAAPVTSAKK